MDGEELFQKGMIGMGALGGVLVALVLCVGVSGIDSWALGLGEEAPEGEQPIADANGAVYVPPDQQVLPWAPAGGMGGKVLVTCASGLLGDAILTLSGDASQPAEVVVLGGQVQAIVLPEVAGEVEVDRGGETLIVSWPAVPANGTGVCKVERKAQQQAPTTP